MSRTSVIIRCCNDADVVRQTLEAILREPGENPEVLCIDSGSTDGTWKILEEYEVRRIRIRPSEYLPGAVLNLGASLARGELLVFLNSDCTPISERFLGCLLAPLREGQAEAVYARQRARPGARWEVVGDYERAFPAPGRSRRSGRESSWNEFFSMAASATKNSVWRNHPMDPALCYSEDVEWAARLRRAGCRVAYAPQAEVYHSHNYDLKSLMSRAAGEGAADFVIFGSEAGRLGAAQAAGGWARCVGRDVLAAAGRGRPDRIPLVVLRRSAWWLGRWLGSRSAGKGLAVRAASVPGFERFLECPAGETAEHWRLQRARDWLLTGLGRELERAVAAPPGARLLLVGSHGRGEGTLVERDGALVPANNLDLLLVLQKRRQVRREGRVWAEAVARVARRLRISIDLAVASEASLRRQAPTLLQYDGGVAQRMLLGSARAPRPWAQPRLLDLAPREQMMLILNRGALLLLNRYLRRHGSQGKGLAERLLWHTLKAALGFGDAALLGLGAYHGLERIRLARVQSGALSCLESGGEMADLYALAARLRRHPPQHPDPARSASLELRLLDVGERFLRGMEARRLGCSDLKWEQYPALILRERPMRRGVGWLRSAKRVWSGWDRDMHELLGQLPLLLFRRGRDDQEGTGEVDGFLFRWAQRCDPGLVSRLRALGFRDQHCVERIHEVAARP